ncbi:unnamed protein product, partial [Owenia fusiformis]
MKTSKMTHKYRKSKIIQYKLLENQKSIKMKTSLMPTQKPKIKTLGLLTLMLFLRMGTTQGSEVESRSVCACFSDGFIRIDCEPDHLILIKRELLGYSKTCPGKCQYKSHGGGCEQEYKKVSWFCEGKQNCFTGVERGTCGSTLTNYLYVEYQCVP